MNIYLDLEDSFYKLVTTLFPDWRVSFPFQNGPELQTPYLLIDVKKIDGVGREQNSGLVTIGLDNNGVTTTIQNYQAKIRFELIGKNDSNMTAAEMMHQLELNLRTPQSYAIQKELNLSLMNIGAVERLPLKRETDVYMYYQLDTTFAYAVLHTSSQDWVDGVGITGVYLEAGREPDHKIVSTIDIPNQE